MNCSRCGARTAGICPRCDARQSPDPTYRGLSFPFLPSLPLPPLRHTLRSFVNRRWGEYHRMVQGELWDEGERQLSRVQLQSLSVYTVDRYTAVGTRPDCILTNRRLLVFDVDGHLIEVMLQKIGAVRDYRDYDVPEGYSYWVALDLADSGVHEPRGDICLECRTQQESLALAGSIREGMLVSKRESVAALS